MSTDATPTTSAPETPAGDGPSALEAFVHVRPGYLRATNVEQDGEHAQHYIPTGRALDILGRITRTLRGHGAGHAWSLTGPYGAGKSSFALFLRTLLGPAGPARDAAEQRLMLASQATWHSLTDTGHRSDRGFVLATTTCQRESVTDSLLRAVQRGAADYWGRRLPRALVAPMHLAQTERSARTVAAAVRAMAEYAPVLLLLDEFGKTLEHFAGTAGTAGGDADADLFVLQELAEQRSGNHPVLLLTLQHLAFDDYVRGSSLLQRREWGKIAGRFEDVPFLETTEQSLRLVAGALDDTAVSGSLADRRHAWAQRCQHHLQALGLHTLLPGGQDTLERCYPLHPLRCSRCPACAPGSVSTAGPCSRSSPAPNSTRSPRSCVRHRSPAMRPP